MKILLADDHALIRSGLRSELSDFVPDVHFVDAWDAESLHTEMSAHRDLDLALIDLTMPGMQAAATIEQLRERYPAIPMIVISAMEAVDMAESVLRAGAAGFIPKSTVSSVIVQAIRLVLAGGRYVPPELLARTIGSAHGVAPKVAHDRNGQTGASASSGMSMLSPRQREVFDLLAQGLSNKHIARALGITEGTVKTHVATIFDVLNVRNRVSAVAEARRLKEERADRDA